MTYFLSLQVGGFFYLGPVLSGKALQPGFVQTRGICFVTLLIGIVSQPHLVSRLMSPKTLFYNN